METETDPSEAFEGAAEEIVEVDNDEKMLVILMLLIKIPIHCKFTL